MAEFYQDVHQRGLQTIAVWGQHAVAFKAGKLTLAQHTTDVGSILTAASAWEAAGSGLEEARDARDTADEALNSLCVHAPDAIEGDLEEGDDLLDDLPDIRGVRMSNPQKTLERARKVVVLWGKVNARHAADVPPEPDLKAKGMTLAECEALMDELEAALQEVQNKLSDARKGAGALKRAATKADKQNKKWYVAWQGEFAVGTPERDALQQIDTGSPTPEPGPLEIESVSPLADGEFEIAYTPGGGGHATSLIAQWQVVGVDEDFGHDTAVNLAGQTISTGAAAGTEVHFRTKGTNSSGTTFSAVVSGTAQ